ncbi:peptidoglycan-binding protein LysM [Brachybacterium vulturis]|uniref:Peptidoglycan-binding protein LysM n=1 Tax=Brachybacterium vulturis TaxID=2017484 RepID=A0A291GRB4_9MICO|nr:LysM peptidoglycan-binding domain-containing protein [Brachybacterium vulturis]ATG52536.1 peptidoglycan-binding protein LysM [Brachybacterium vulturis]
MRTDIATVLPIPSRVTSRHDVAPRARVRLEPTRRGRLLITALAFVLGLLVAGAVLLSVDLPALAGTESEQPVTITVEAGDTLWGFAEQYAPEGVSAQEFITEVRVHNQLPTGRVTAGQEIELPFLEDAAR